MPATPPPDLIFIGGSITRPLTIRRHARARSMRLAIDPRDGTVRLTLPPRAALKPALAWAEEKRGWIEAALAKIGAADPIGPGARVPYLGEELLIVPAPGPRGVRREGDRLLVGGPADAIGARVIRWLRAEALALFTADTAEIAARAGVTIGRVSIGDPKARWGSCAAGGDIRYSWRLVMAPAAVRRSVVAHEVAHRVHMNHGPAFHRLVADLLGREPVADRAWLRAHGARLHRVG